MNSRDISQAAKTAIFILGLLIVCLAIYWLVPWVPGGMENRLFVACDAVLLYLAVFIPPLTLPRLSKASTGRIVSLGILYWGIGLYAVYTIVLIALACSQLYMATHLLIILQLIGLFVRTHQVYGVVCRDWRISSGRYLYGCHGEGRADSRRAALPEPCAGKPGIHPGGSDLRTIDRAFRPHTEGRERRRKSRGAFSQGRRRAAPHTAEESADELTD